MKISNYLNLVTRDRFNYEKDRLIRLVEQLEKENEELKRIINIIPEYIEDENYHDIIKICKRINNETTNNTI